MHVQHIKTFLTTKTILVVNAFTTYKNFLTIKNILNILVINAFTTCKNFFNYKEHLSNKCIYNI